MRVSFGSVFWGIAAVWSLAVGAAGASCSGGSDGSDGSDGGGRDATVDGVDDSEPLLCTEFTEVGAPCPMTSPVRCFPLCEAGGCFCSSTSQGPRWRCVTDLSCQADCAPQDDGCAPGATGDDGGASESGPDDGADDASDDGASG